VAAAQGEDVADSGLFEGPRDELPARQIGHLGIGRITASTLSAP
jgi:hypothetical protein